MFNLLSSKFKTRICRCILNHNWENCVPACQVEIYTFKHAWPKTRTQTGLWARPSQTGKMKTNFQMYRDRPQNKVSFINRLGQLKNKLVGLGRLKNKLVGLGRLKKNWTDKPSRKENCPPDWYNKFKKDGLSRLNMNTSV